MQYDQWPLGIYAAVVANNTDPMGQARIKVLIPQVSGTAMSNWAIPTLPAAISRIPAVKEQVFVFFHGGDLAHPVYIASAVPYLNVNIQGPTASVAIEAPSGYVTH